MRVFLTPFLLSPNNTFNSSQIIIEEGIITSATNPLGVFAKLAAYPA
jgi:hypothetical protein